MAWRMPWDPLTPRELEIRKISIERCNLALQLREQGNTFKKVGEIMGISGSRAAQLVGTAQRIRDRRRRISESIDRIEQGK